MEMYRRMRREKGEGNGQWKDKEGGEKEEKGNGRREGERGARNRTNRFRRDEFKTHSIDVGNMKSEGIEKESERQADI